MSERWPGSLINKTAPTSSGGGAQDSAPGVWTLDQANPYIASGTWPGTGVPDPQFQYVTALLHGDGINAAQNNTFLDSSSNNFTITRNGNTTQGSFSPYGPLWGNYFASSSSSYLSVPDNAALELGTNSFTMEAWVFPTSFASTYAVLSKMTSSGTASGFLFNVSSSSGLLLFYASSNGSSWDIVSALGSINLALNSWNHIAVGRSGSTFRLWVNGSSSGTATSSGSVENNSASVLIGAAGQSSTANFANSYISNARIVNGTDVYGVSNPTITVPTAPLTAVTNTALLTCQSNRFIDNSTNNFTLTTSGSPSVQRFSPFQNLATYQTSKIGGSAYLATGGTDYLTVASNAAYCPGTSAFCVEFWYNKLAYGGNEGTLINTEATGGLIITIAGGGVALSQRSTGNNLQSSANPIVGQWNHIVACRDSSNNTAIFLNGTRVANGTVTANYATGSLYIGDLPVSGYWATGYYSDVRIEKGSTPYDPTLTTLTVPTAPLTNITNTSLLTNFTNGAIYDNAAMNDLQTVGNAQISTSVVKYGTGSMKFNGSTDYIVSPSSTLNQLGTGNFTVEFWVYVNSYVDGDTAFSLGTYGAYFPNIMIRMNSNWTISIGNGSSWALVDQDFGIPKFNTWNHIAISRVSGVLYAFYNGNLGYSAANTTNMVLQQVVLGKNTNYSFYLNGYIDDLRITKGYARYWFNFQPPAAPYPNYGGTLQLTYDPNFANTTLLLNGEGTNGAQNNTFLDSSTNNFTITRNGNTTQGSFSPYGSLWGNYFNGSSNLTAPSNSAYTFGSSGDFTIECWVYLTAAQPSPVGVLMTNYVDWNTGYNNYWIFQVRNGNQLNWLDSAGNNAITASSATAITYNFWNHVAIVRSGSTITMYINGTAVGTYSGGSQAYTGTNALSIGYVSGANYLSGYVSNARIVKGTAVYTSNFTPPTTPLTAITNTSILTCQSNRFIDNSSNNFTITAVGTPTVQRFSPFNPTAPYSTSVIGGSGYFDGSGDSLVLPAGSADFMHQGATNWTFECWFNCPNTSSYYTIYSTDGNTGSIGFALGVNGTTAGDIELDIYKGSSPAYSTVTTSGVWTPNTWTHLALTFNGTTKAVVIYINGVSKTVTSTGLTTFSGSAATYAPAIGMLQYATGPGFYFPGYISNLRTVNNFLVYTANFTPPTAPVTAVTGTTLLTNFTNAGIPDLAMQNNLETVGNAQVSTSVKKYGTGSLSFDGSGDYLLSNPPSTNLYAFGTGDFTIEFWIYFNSVSGVIVLYDPRNTSETNCPVLYMSSGVLYFYTNGSNLITGSSLSTSTWYHIALARSGTSTKLFINGTQSGSTYTDTNNYACQTNRPAIAANGFVSGGGVGLYPLNGYIDDFRITNGLARYTANFTPPTAALPTY